MATKITEYMTPAEVAQLWRVDLRTLARWEKGGKFPPGTIVRTPGGHRRFRTAGIQAMLNGHDGGQS